MKLSVTTAAAVVSMFPTVFAHEPFSTFENMLGVRIGTTNFELTNVGCFHVAGASQVYFTKGFIHGRKADGPYCLTGYADADCNTDSTGTQVFENFDIQTETRYELIEGVALAENYRWTAGYCI